MYLYIKIGDAMLNTFGVIGAVRIREGGDLAKSSLKIQH